MRLVIWFGRIHHSTFSIWWTDDIFPACSWTRILHPDLFLGPWFILLDNSFLSNRAEVL